MMRELPGCGPGHCMTCGDEGIPMSVLRVDEGRGLALCATDAGERQTVEIALIEPVAPGDLLLVHAGTAIAALPAQPAVQRWPNRRCSDDPTGGAAMTQPAVQR